MLFRSSWEEFDRKGYHIVNAPPERRPTPALRWFAEGRACDTPDAMNPKRDTERGGELGTYSGKIEFSSLSLARFTPEDNERAVTPRFTPSWEGHVSPLAER